VVFKKLLLSQSTTRLAIQERQNNNSNGRKMYHLNQH